MKNGRDSVRCATTLFISKLQCVKFFFNVFSKFFVNQSFHTFKKTNVGGTCRKSLITVECFFFGTGIMFNIFQRSGTMPSSRLKLNIWQKTGAIDLLQYFNTRPEMLSGPVEFLSFICPKTAVTSLILKECFFSDNHFGNFPQM